MDATENIFRNKNLVKGQLYSYKLLVRNLLRVLNIKKLPLLQKNKIKINQIKSVLRKCNANEDYDFLIKFFFFVEFLCCAIEFSTFLIKMSMAAEVSGISFRVK